MKTNIEMAREAGLPKPPTEMNDWANVTGHWITRFAALVRADEREACAKVAEQHPAYDWAPAICEITYAIRARGNT